MSRWVVVVAAGLIVVGGGARAGAQCEVGQLVPPVPQGDDWFGADVALDGDVAVVGQATTPFSTNPSWVFELLPEGWSAGSPLPPPDFVTWYGDSVGVWGETIVVAGQMLNDLGVGATVFERVGGAWVETAKLYTPDVVPQVSPVLNVAIEGDTILVADRHMGAVYVFDRIGGVWSTTPSQTLAPLALGFGDSVRLHNGRAVVGGCGGLVPGECDGSAWVFVKQGGVFVEVAQLVTQDPEENNLTGSVLAQSDDAIAVGAPYHGLGFPVTGIGAVYVFERVGGAWVQTAFVTAPGPQLGDTFGAAVALQGDLLVVGAPNRDAAGPVPVADAGAVYAYRRSGTAWLHVSTFQASEPVTYGRYGSSLAIDDDTLLVGARLGEVVGLGWVYDVRGLLGLTDWLPLGGGVAGNGSPCTFGTGVPAVGAPATVTLVGALPAQPGWLVLGVERINAPFKGGVLVPAPQLLVPLLTDAKGGTIFGWTWPPGLPPGLKLSLQHWIVDGGAPAGLAAADALLVDVP